MARAPKGKEWRKCEGLCYYRAAKGSKEGTRNATFMVGMSYDKEFVLCEQYWGSITREKFAQIVQSALPVALDKSINPLERRILMDGCPRQNSKVAKKAMQNINAIVMAIPDLIPIENIFAQVSRILQKQAVEQNITKEIFSEFSARVKDNLIGFDREKINKVIDSILKRLNDVLKAKGQSISY